jgi:hypothetical protein
MMERIEKEEKDERRGEEGRRKEWREKENRLGIGTATKRSITQRLRHKTKLLLNVAAHNVAVTKRKSY